MNFLFAALTLLFGLPLFAQIRCDQAQRMSLFDSIYRQANFPVYLEPAGFGDGSPIFVNLNRENPNDPYLEIGDKKLSLHDGPFYVNGNQTPGRVEAKIEIIAPNTVQISNRIFSQANLRLLNFRRNVIVRLTFAEPASELSQASVTTFRSTRTVVDGSTQERPIETTINRITYTKRP